MRLTQVMRDRETLTEEEVDKMGWSRGRVEERSLEGGLCRRCRGKGGNILMLHLGSHSTCLLAVPSPLPKTLSTN